MKKKHHLYWKITATFKSREWPRSFVKLMESAPSIHRNKVVGPDIHWNQAVDSGLLQAYACHIPNMLLHFFLSIFFFLIWTFCECSGLSSLLSSIPNSRAIINTSVCTQVLPNIYHLSKKTRQPIQSTTQSNIQVYKRPPWFYSQPRLRLRKNSPAHFFFISVDRQ